MFVFVHLYFAQKQKLQANTVYREQDQELFVKPWMIAQMYFV